MQVSFYEEKGKVDAISRGLDLGEVVCRGRESCLSRGSKGTALMVQLRSDQVKTVWFGHINRMVKCSHFSDFPTMIIFDPLRPKNCCPWVGNGVTSFTFGFGRKRSRPWCHLDLPILEIVHHLWFFPGLFSNMIEFSWKPEETFPGLFNSSFWFERKRSSESGGADDQTWRETEEKEGNQRIIRIIRAWRETEEGLQEAL